MPVVSIEIDYSEQELLMMTKAEATQGINEKQQRFCENYLYCYSIKMASLKAGYAESDASMMGYYLRQKQGIRRYICWLKARVLNDAFLSARDVIEQYAKIAFADITDFVEILPHSLRLKPANQIDGQIIKSLRTGRDGVSIELHDKLKSLEQLIRYCEYMPKDWKQRFEERKLEILEQEFLLRKQNAELSGNEDEDDGFITALKESATTIWAEDNENI